MPQPLKDAEHLVRMAVLFAIGVVVFLVLRGVLIPEDFGELGHYRTGALADARSVEARFAGRSACADCHDDAAAELAGGIHASVGCEACHGALAGHASDPDAMVPPVLEVRPLCTTCHAAGAAKPDWFPQVDPIEHAGDESCDECHLPHQPGM
jgi:hypothetical protein